MRSWTAVPRIMRYASAIASVGVLAIVGACADSSTSPRLNTPESPAFAPGVANPKTIEVCISASSPDGTYSIDLSATSGTVAGDIITDPVVLVKSGVASCGIAIVRAGADPTMVTTTLTASALVAGTFSYSCVDDVLVNDPLCVSGTAGVNGAVVQMNNFHGTTTTFTFVAAPPPPPPTVGCTFTQGYYKNKGNALIAGNTNFDGSGLSETQILNTPSGGNGYIILAKQYIAAKANIAGGASIVGDALTAYNAATAYFATGLTIANPYNATYTKDVLTALGATLDAYNNGTAGQGNPIHCP